MSSPQTHRILLKKLSFPTYKETDLHGDEGFNGAISVFLGITKCYQQLQILLEIQGCLKRTDLDNLI